MAEFCKEAGMGFHDFSIREVADNLEPDTYSPCLCEAWGFIGIAKDSTSNIGLIYDLTYTGHWDNVEFVDFDPVQEKLSVCNPSEKLHNFLMQYAIPHVHVDKLKFTVPEQE